MGIFNRGPKKFRGRITDEASGIYIELPAGWYAYSIDKSYMIGLGNKTGILFFSVESYLTIAPGYDINESVGKRVPLWHPGTDEEIEGDVTREGDYVVWSVVSKIKDSIFTSFETDTEKYVIRFFYQATKKERELGINSVWQILSSLVKYPDGKT
jgi:hypothetical protein